jgi:hypothetical protein
VFLVCFAALGLAKVVLRMILDTFVAAKMRLFSRWGLCRTAVRLFEHEARTGQSRHAYFIGGMLSRAVMGSATVTVALVIALTPTGLPAWAVWASVVIGFPRPGSRAGWLPVTSAFACEAGGVAARRADGAPGVVRADWKVLRWSTRGWVGPG